MQTTIRSVVPVALALVGLSAPSLAGPLDPPVGPITSTAKPLAEIEPRTAINAANTPGDADSIFRIAQPGSYYLPANVTGQAAKRGIEIAASGVTFRIGGDRAFYAPAHDIVQVPPQPAFFEQINYYRTCLHELTHNAVIRIMPHLIGSARSAV